jgi:molecular chaperone DnaK
MREPVIGIDLGTTYSAVATVEEGRPKVIVNRVGGRLTPSMIGFGRAGERLVGDAARMLASELPEHVAWATKRWIGRRWSLELAEEAKKVVPYPLVAGPANEVRIKVANRTLPITQVSAMILGELRLDAEAYFGRPVNKAVITVPANFDDSQRTATKEAARIAGLDVLRIINEPTAAAVAYGLGATFAGRALVFDLGGGTFDVSILEVQNGVFEVKATGGDPQLGGEDFDNRIVQWLLAQVPENFREVVAKDKLSFQRLKVAAERAKRELTEKSEAQIDVAELGDHTTQGNRKFTEVETALTRDFFHVLCEPLSKRCIEVCRDVMTEAKLERGQIDAVLLVGGMTRVPLVQKLVTEFFGKPPSKGFNPDEVVALGAAVQANELAERGGAALLIDVASHSLGVGVFGGHVRRLIQRNTAIPVVAREVFVPSAGGQTAARIPIYQGEGDTAEENSKLGELVLRDLATGSRADVPIEVTFELSSEGTLSVRAIDTTTGLAEAIRIEARTDLSGGELEKLRQEQAAHAKAASARDAENSVDQFKKVIDKAEKLARMLEASATENPSEGATAAVANVRSLIDAGRAALKAQDSAQMANVTRMIEKLVRAPR